MTQNTYLSTCNLIAYVIQCQSFHKATSAIVQMNIPGMNSIVEFYSGADIFITGGSGFVGKVLIEKLLRSCPDIGTIYLLMRPKRGQKSQDRINKLTGDMVSNKYYFLIHCKK